MPSGIFSDKEKAEEWIASNRLTGLLSGFPVDMGVLDWAIRCAGFNPPDEKRTDPSYVARFTSGAVEHFHFENGNRVA
jgi:hypothetical protein